jgi:Rps23 Pro-64 3,4-dihydroxylase Tpa1-like proline 4-hydroxylase
MNSLDLANIIASKIRADSARAKVMWSAPVNTETRHFFIDDLLPANIAEDIFSKFPLDHQMWHQRDSFRERKKTFAKLNTIDSLVEAITDAFHKPDVVEIVTEITDISDLEPDPNLYAGGISMMEKGDFLNPHIDNSHDRDRKNYRRLNLLYYVTPGWSQKDGGNLELWDKKVLNPFEIVSKFNRLVVMETDSNSWHSVNQVRAISNRCCVSNYYFSKSSPADKEYYHVTSFLGRPNQKVRRIFGHLDNAARQFVATGLGISRGRNLGRDPKGEN